MPFPKDSGAALRGLLLATALQFSAQQGLQATHQQAIGRKRQTLSPGHDRLDRLGHGGQRSSTRKQLRIHAANAFGLYDTAGNVWEWCEDWYDPPARTLKVLRGASWRTGNPERHWSSYRGPDPPSCRLDSAGFRLVLERSPSD